MIVETLPLVGSSTPLQNHIKVIGGVTVRRLQSRVIIILGILTPSIDAFIGVVITITKSPSGGTPVGHKQE